MTTSGAAITRSPSWAGRWPPPKRAGWNGCSPMRARLDCSQKRHKPMLRFFRALLWFYPGEFRDEYGREIALVFADRYRNTRNPLERAGVFTEALMGLL